MTDSSILGAFSPALLAPLLVLAGCAFSLDPGGFDSEPSEAPLSFDGAEMALVRYSTRCERAGRKSLTAEVGDSMEFEASAVATLESPCADAPSPAVAVAIDHDALLFDFSEVIAPDRFPTAEFEGYVIDLDLRSHNGLLIAATVSAQSTIPIRHDDIYHEPDHIEVNFEGLSYDERGFVKIDLLFADVPPAIDGDS